MHLQWKHLPAISFWRVLLSPLTAAACTSDANEEPLKRQFAEIFILFQGITIGQICATNIFYRNSVLEKKNQNHINKTELFSQWVINIIQTMLKRMSIRNRKEKNMGFIC